MFEMHFTVYKIYYYRSSCSLFMPYRSGSDWRPVRAQPHRGHAQPLQGSRPQEAEGWRGDRGRGRGVGTPAVSRHQVSNIIIIIITIIIINIIIIIIITYNHHYHDIPHCHDWQVLLPQGPGDQQEDQHRGQAEAQGRRPDTATNTRGGLRVATDDLLLVVVN